MKKFMSMSGTVAASGLLVLGAAFPAVASKYYSDTNTLKAWQDNVVQAEMYGRFAVEDLSYARNYTHHRDSRPGGDAAYEETFYDWYQNGVFKTDIGTDTSPKDSSGDWVGQYDQQQLNPCCDSVRMYTNVCEDHGVWSKDPCSIRPTQKYNY